MARKSPAAAAAGRKVSLPQEGEQTPPKKSSGKGGFTTGAGTGAPVHLAGKGPKAEARKGKR
jgi:hypothetical protein